MGAVVNSARKAYRFAKKVAGVKEPVDSNPFPIDAWTDPAYQAWFEAHKATEAELDSQRAASRGFELRPKFSLIVPLYKTPLDYLAVMADSVLAQTYDNLELVLVNASPEMAELRAAVEALVARDARVKVVEVAKNLGITENTNAGLAEATGDFCCFLDHDDFIEPDLLFEYVKAINEQPDIDVLYCDEDLVEEGEDGEFKHLHVLFKPQITPELLLCKNSVVHLMTVRRELLDRMPRPTCTFDGAQDYNMILWCSGAARRVHGVPKVLYHWRISAESTAANPDAKPYSQKSYRLAANGELARRGGTGRIVSSGIVNVHNVWFKGEGLPSVSVVVDCAAWADEPPAEGACPFNTIDRFVEFFEQSNALEGAEVLLVNPGSAHGPLPEGFKAVEVAESFAGLSEGPGAIVEAASLEKSSVGSKPNDSRALRADATSDQDAADAASTAGRLARLNAGAAVAAGDYLVFADAGCFFDTAEPLEQLVGACELEGVGVTAPKVFYRNGRNKTYGVAVTAERVMPLYRGYEDDFPGYQCNIRSFQNSSACGLQGLCVSRALFGELGGFDERFAGELGAVDLCHRVLGRGLRVANLCTVKLRCDDACPEHFFVNSENAPDYPSCEVALFDAKWPGLRAAGDPYFSPNLDQSSSYCQLPR